MHGLCTLDKISCTRWRLQRGKIDLGQLKSSPCSVGFGVAFSPCDGPSLIFNKLLNGMCLLSNCRPPLTWLVQSKQKNKFYIWAEPRPTFYSEGWTQLYWGPNAKEYGLRKLDSRWITHDPTGLSKMACYWTHYASLVLRVFPFFLCFISYLVNFILNSPYLLPYHNCNTISLD